MEQPKLIRLWTLCKTNRYVSSQPAQQWLKQEARLLVTEQFTSVEEMQEAIIERNNSIVTDEDDLYILGDITMGQDLDTGIKCLERLRGKKHIILGNHDSAKKTEAYQQVPNVEVLGYAAVIRYRKRQIYLCHYPTLVANTADREKHLRDLIFNFFGHTHQQDTFFHPDGDPNRTIPTMYHVGVDAHDCYPVAIEQIINEIWSQYRNQPFKQEQTANSLIKQRKTALRGHLNQLSFFLYLCVCFGLYFRFRKAEKK